MKRFLSLIISALCAVGAWAQNTHNGHEYVDLGLSVRWATCNVGANTPQSAGDYYSWGGKETLYEAGSDMENPTWKEGYSAGYDYSSYEYMDHSKDSYFGYTKYTIDDGASDGVWYNSEGEFIGDGKNELEDVDDVAVQKWGGRWKMPTLEQQLELSYGCYWVWTNTYNGESVNGYIVYKAKKEEDQGVYVSEYGTPSSDYDVATDAHIFLPAAGYFKGAGLSDNGELGRYWMRPLEFDGTFNAFCIGFSNYGVDKIVTTERRFGCLVRPVYEPTPIAQIGETIYTGVDAFITAFEAIEGKATVQLLDDITLSDEKEFNNENSGADITFDLNGHNITNNSDYCTTFRIKDSKLTIAGQGVVEVTSELSSVFVSNGTMVINSGTYKSKSAICFVYLTANLIIKGGKFNAAAVYKDDGDFAIKPIVKGGLFSMDPSACVADGSEMVDNDDEETKDEYLYKVVALPIAQIGETIYTDVDAFITAFSEIEDKATVQLLDDIILPKDKSLGNKNENANITLDLNGHNITGNRYYNAVIFAVYCKLTISGEGVVENKGEDGDVVGCEGYVEINGGTYIGTADICFVDGVMIINGGKFNAPKLYYNDDDYYAPTVKGGLFSMDPSVGVAVGYEVVNNDDEATKAEYPYKVVTLPIAQITIGEETTKYYDAVTLINAVFASQETASVKLLADINLGNGSLTISKKDTEVVLDLNGHSLNGAVMTSNNNAHLIICDNSEEQTGSIVSSNIPVIAFASTSITINGGTFVGKTAIYLDDESSVTLNAGKFDVVEKTLDYASENATITLGEGKALKLADNTILTKITGNVEQSSEVIDAPSTPTAIERINADKAQKAVKTIENGKVVIIRGDKKYDLSGREL